jgi:Domain of unknown function (DUF397)
VDAINQHERGFTPIVWKRSSRCGPDGGDCVEVDLRHAGKIAVRRSTRPLSPTTELLVFDPDKWGVFVDLAGDGRFRDKSATP